MFVGLRLWLWFWLLVCWVFLLVGLVVVNSVGIVLFLFDWFVWLGLVMLSVCGW